MREAILTTPAIPAAIDLSVLLKPLLELLGTLALAMLTAALRRLFEWLGLRNRSQLRLVFDDILQKGILWGIQQAEDLIRVKGWDHLDVRDKTVAEALDYITARFGASLAPVLRQDGLRLGSDAAGAELRAALERAYPVAAGIAAASPVTPPAPPAPPQMAVLASPTPA